MATILSLRNVMKISDYIVHNVVMEYVVSLEVFNGQILHSV